MFYRNFYWPEDSPSTYVPIYLSDLVYFNPIASSCPDYTISSISLPSEMTFTEINPSDLSGYSISWSSPNTDPISTDSYSATLRATTCNNVHFDFDVVIRFEDLSFTVTSSASTTSSSPVLLYLSQQSSWTIDFTLKDSNLDGFGTLTAEIYGRLTSSTGSYTLQSNSDLPQTISVSNPSYASGTYTGTITVTITPTSMSLADQSYEYQIKTSYSPSWRPRPTNDPLLGQSSYSQFFTYRNCESVSTCAWNSDLIYFSNTYWSSHNSPLVLDQLIYFDPSSSNCPYYSFAPQSGMGSDISFTEITDSSLNGYEFTWVGPSAPASTAQYKVSLLASNCHGDSFNFDVNLVFTDLAYQTTSSSTTSDVSPQTLYITQSATWTIQFSLTDSNLFSFGNLDYQLYGRQTNSGNSYTLMDNSVMPNSITINPPTFSNNVFQGSLITTITPNDVSLDGIEYEFVLKTNYHPTWMVKPTSQELLQTTSYGEFFLLKECVSASTCAWTQDIIYYYNFVWTTPWSPITLQDLIYFKSTVSNCPIWNFALSGSLPTQISLQELTSGQLDGYELTWISGTDPVDSDSYKIDFTATNCHGSSFSFSVPIRFQELSVARTGSSSSSLNSPTTLYVDQTASWSSGFTVTDTNLFGLGTISCKLMGKSSDDSSFSNYDNSQLPQTISVTNPTTYISGQYTQGLISVTITPSDVATFADKTWQFRVLIRYTPAWYARPGSVLVRKNTYSEYFSIQECVSEASCPFNANLIYFKYSDNYWKVPSNAYVMDDLIYFDPSASNCPIWWMEAQSIDGSALQFNENTQSTLTGYDFTWIASGTPSSSSSYNVDIKATNCHATQFTFSVPIRFQDLTLSLTTDGTTSSSSPGKMYINDELTFSVTISITDTDLYNIGTLTNILQGREYNSGASFGTLPSSSFTYTVEFPSNSYTSGAYTGFVQVKITCTDTLQDGKTYEFKVQSDYKPNWRTLPDETILLTNSASIYYDIVLCTLDTINCPWNSDFIYYNAAYWQGPDYSTPVLLSHFVYQNPSISNCPGWQISCLDCPSGQIQLQSIVSNQLSGYELLWIDSSDPSPTSSYKVTMQATDCRSQTFDFDFPIMFQELFLNFTSTQSSTETSPQSISSGYSYSWDVTFELTDTDLYGFGTLTNTLMSKTSSSGTYSAVSQSDCGHSMSVSTPTYASGKYSATITITMSPIDSDSFLGSNRWYVVQSTYVPAWRTKPADVQLLQTNSEVNYIYLLNCITLTSACDWSSSFVYYYYTGFWDVPANTTNSVGNMNLEDLIYESPSSSNCPAYKLQCVDCPTNFDLYGQADEWPGQINQYDFVMATNGSLSLTQSGAKVQIRATNCHQDTFDFYMPIPFAELKIEIEPNAYPSQSSSSPSTVWWEQENHFYYGYDVYDTDTYGLGTFATSFVVRDLGSTGAYVDANAFGFTNTAQVYSSVYNSSGGNYYVRFQVTVTVTDYSMRFEKYDTKFTISYVPAWRTRPSNEQLFSTTNVCYFYVKDCINMEGDGPSSSESWMTTPMPADQTNRRGDTATVWFPYWTTYYDDCYRRGFWLQEFTDKTRKEVQNNLIQLNGNNLYDPSVDARAKLKSVTSNEYSGYVEIYMRLTNLQNNTQYTEIMTWTIDPECKDKEPDVTTFFHNYTIYEPGWETNLVSRIIPQYACSVHLVYLDYVMMVTGNEVSYLDNWQLRYDIDDTTNYNGTFYYQSDDLSDVQAVNQYFNYSVKIFLTDQTGLDASETGWILESFYLHIEKPCSGSQLELINGYLFLNPEPYTVREAPGSKNFEILPQFVNSVCEMGFRLLNQNNTLATNADGSIIDTNWSIWSINPSTGEISWQKDTNYDDESEVSEIYTVLIEIYGVQHDEVAQVSDAQASYVSNPLEISIQIYHQCNNIQISWQSGNTLAISSSYNYILYEDDDVTDPDNPVLELQTIDYSDINVTFYNEWWGYSNWSSICGEFIWDVQGVNVNATRIALFMTVTQLDTALSESKTQPYMQIGTQESWLASEPTNQIKHTSQILNSGGIDWLTQGSNGNKAIEMDQQVTILTYCQYFILEEPSLYPSYQVTFNMLGPTKILSIPIAQVSLAANSPNLNLTDYTRYCGNQLTNLTYPDFYSEYTLNSQTDVLGYSLVTDIVTDDYSLIDQHFLVVKNYFERGIESQALINQFTIDIAECIIATADELVGDYNGFVIEYKVSSPIISIPINNVTYTPNCGYQIAYYIEEETPTPQINSILPYAYFVESESDDGSINRELQIYTQSESTSEQTYTFRIIAQVLGYPDGDYYVKSDPYSLSILTNIVPTNSPPYFDPELEADVSLDPGQSWQYQLPSLVDDEGDETQITSIILTDDLLAPVDHKSWASWDISKTPTTIIIDVPEDMAGKKLQFEISAEDKNEKKAGFTTYMYITITGEQETEEEVDEDQTIFDFNSNKESSDGPTFKLSKIASNGQITMQFSQKMKWPFTAPKAKSRRLDNQVFKNFVGVYLQQNVQNEIWAKEEALGFDYELARLTPTQIFIQMIFKNPQAISCVAPDQIDVKLLRRQAFVGEETGSYVQSSQVLIKGVMSKQMEAGAAKNMQAAASTATAAVGGAAAGSIIVQIVMAGGLQQVWGLVNCLQVVCNAVFLNIQTPANVLMIFKGLLDLVNFDLFDPGPIYDVIFDFEDTRPYTEGLAALGFDSSCFIELLGSMFVTFVFSISLVIFMKVFSQSIGQIILKKLTKMGTKSKGKMAKTIKAFKNLNIKMTLLIFFVEAYMELALSGGIVSIMSYKYPDENFTNGSMVFSQVLGFIATAVTIFLPIWLYKVTFKYKKLREEKKDRNEIELLKPIFEEFKHKRVVPLLYQFLFIVRRAILILAFLLLQKYGWAQIYCFLFPTQWFAMFLLNEYPHKNEFISRMETFNEICNFFNGYHLFYFTAWAESLDMQYSAGKSLLICVGLQVCVNMYFMLGGMVKNGSNSIKEKVVNHKEKQRVRKIKKIRKREDRRHQFEEKRTKINTINYHSHVNKLYANEGQYLDSLSEIGEMKNESDSGNEHVESLTKVQARRDREALIKEGLEPKYDQEKRDKMYFPPGYKEVQQQKKDRWVKNLELSRQSSLTNSVQDDKSNAPRRPLIDLNDIRPQNEINQEPNTEILRPPTESSFSQLIPDKEQTKNQIIQDSNNLQGYVQTKFKARKTTISQKEEQDQISKNQSTNSLIDQSDNQIGEQNIYKMQTISSNDQKSVKSQARKRVKKLPS